MNDFEKNYFSENDGLNNFSQSEEISPDSSSLVQVPSYEWNTDDFQNHSLVNNTALALSGQKPKKKLSRTKRIIAAALIISVLNLAVLGGMFAVGYGFGSGKLSFNSKVEALENLNPSNPDGSGSSGGQIALTQTVTTGNELSTVDISKKVGPAVVGITSTINSGISIFSTSTTSEGTGSGIIISSNGYIITNHHVIDGAVSIKVTLNTGSEYTAKLVGSDKTTDLAVVKITPEETLTVAELGDSSVLQVGERAVAIGNPLGLEFFGSTTQGIISAINRKITVDNRTMSVIQTDAAINEGNSGGPLVNAYGQIIGINTVKISASTVEGMGFAIPISEAKPIIEDLINHGYVKGRPVLGISARNVTQDMAHRQGWPIGVQVMATQPASGAELAGLEQGDIIIKADGKDVKNFDDLTNIKNSHKPGDVMQLEVYKYSTGLNKKVAVKLTEELPE